MNQPLTLGWDPRRTWVFIVGTLEWKHSEYFSSFPKQARRDEALACFFRDRDVPPTQIVYLQDRHATTERILQDFERHLAAAQPDDLLVLYYCGHGARTDNGATYFASYDCDGATNQGWLVETIPALIERSFGGSRALLLADCCYSGYLGETVARQAGRVAYASLTSSLASELSTGNWTFTEALLAGLQGQAYADADGSRYITLQELANQIAENMAFAEEQVATFSISGSFDPGLVLAPALPRPDPQVGRRVEASVGGVWYAAQIIDARDGLFKVRYFGYEANDDEWLPLDSLREAARTVYPAGAQVEVQWKRKWYPATVLDVRSGIHYIQYDEFSAEWNEWVASKRIRPRG